MNKIKICILDIDGVLCSYPDAWIKFVNGHVAQDLQSDNLNELKQKVPYSLYRKLKEDYRISGIKRTLKPIDGASDITVKLRQAGYIIVLLTKRPFLKYKQLFADTLFWVKENNIQQDLIFWGKDKHFQILKYFPDTEFLVEDNHNNANEVAKLGYKVYLLDNPYNRLPLHENVIRINKLSKILTK